MLKQLLSTKLFSNSDSPAIILPKALSLPEILQCIFRNIDSHTLRTVVSLVCRQWLVIVRNLAPLRINLFAEDDSRRRANFLSLLSSARAIELHPASYISPSRSPFPEEVSGCQELLDELVAKFEDLRAIGISLSIDEVSAFGILAHSKSIRTLQPYIGQISILRLLGLRYSPIPSFLNSIIRSCPVLTELRMETSSSWSYQRVNLTDPNSFSLTGPPTTSLKVLVMNSLQLPPGLLESILEKCPELIEFKIERAIPLTGAPPPSYPDITPIIKLALEKCTKLRLFHLSMDDRPYTINEIKTLDECMLSVSRKWSLPEHYFHKIQSDQNSLTYLELTELKYENFGPKFDLEKSDYLHEFLLRAVHLKHLIACCAFIQTEKLDAFSQGDSSDDHSRQVWACRKLETLKIRFSGHGVNENPKYPDLVIFGYLARVCPFLEHLHIHMDVALSEGMCLMSRLQYLKRLYIGVGRSSTISKHDMEWLQPHMTTMETIKYSTFTRLLSIPKTTAGDELDWEHFGKREDIDNCAVERLVAIQQGVPCCLPQLEFLNIYYNFSVFQNLAIREAESYLRKIRPRIRVHIDSRWIQSCGSIVAVNYPYS